ncbi:MAG: acetyl-CoA carboxylase biotin carboxylase subunit [Oligoflexia bacterium]|nr:acetyl-CoA carboxylase biotin carboxylase subunit [Oligoflexia bacterium]
MSGKISKVLIANRGEIALRVIRACRDLGLETVAVYSQADESSLHVKLADEAVCIGPAPSKQSYLNIPFILAAAELTEADAIHPGYGFLSENAEFARICKDCNINFIGPKPESIALLGDKVAARTTATKAGVPLLPGTKGAVDTLAEAEKEAKRIGFPIVLKASAGGGGRGIQIIHSAEKLVTAFDRVRSEAGAAFGKMDVYIEKFCTSPRHVEIQVAADHHGNAVYLGERDCTVQRRHQKLIEEAPCPVIDDQTRKKMGEAAIKLVKEVGYQNVGTVEFLLDADRKSFYFMEMNTRVQVEHPVTEMITGVDIVKLQLLIASGKPLPFTQEEIKIKGHSIECRINAEDPETFAPCPGKIDGLHVPGGFGVRFDSFIYNQYTVPPNYDSLLGKLIVFEESRELCIMKMQRALDELKIGGIKTNTDFYKKVLLNKKFKENQYDTHFLEEFLPKKS